MLADATRKWTERAAGALVDQLLSPPRYGSAEVTDWGDGSEHQRLRARIDEAARQTLGRSAD